MTLEEMKLAVCEKLPELLTVVRLPSHYNPSKGGVETPCRFHWNDGFDDVLWEREGLAVCHEAEKLLDKHNAVERNNGIYHSEASLYVCLLLGDEDWPTLGFDAPALFDLANTTYEQRLEALCRVWWPDKFN